MVPCHCREVLPVHIRFCFLSHESQSPPSRKTSFTSIATRNLSFRFFRLAVPFSHSPFVFGTAQATRIPRSGVNKAGTSSVITIAGHLTFEFELRIVTRAPVPQEEPYPFRALLSSFHRFKDPFSGRWGCQKNVLGSPSRRLASLTVHRWSKTCRQHKTIDLLLEALDIECSSRRWRRWRI